LRELMIAHIAPDHLLGLHLPSCAN
jgi:hypothetical protein